MPTIIHCADLHLTSGIDKDYSFSVMEEILELAGNEKADYLIIAGDLFDSFDDFMALKQEFVKRAEAAGNLGIFFIPGNHDVLRKKDRSFQNHFLGRNVTPFYKEPFELYTSDEFEIIAIPHQDSYSGYAEWDVPKKTLPRISVLHGLVNGMGIHTGTEPGMEEEGTVAIDPDIFTRFHVDYAALGHIHSGRKRMIGGSELNYPGSARVWRRGETGKRGVNLLNIGARISSEWLPLSSAGEYRLYDLPIGLDGTLGEIGELSRGWGKPDLIEIKLQGIVENENILACMKERFENDFKNCVRGIDISFSNVRTVPGILTQPVARKFMEKMKGMKDGMEPRLWLKALELGLGSIADVMEGRQ